MELRKFRNGSSYFALRAKKARKPGIKERFLEDAAFYDTLASITPTFPHGYQRPASSGNRWRDRAEECRTMAACFENETCRRRLIGIAEEYERLAHQREDLKK